jgi:hypothetical protein
MCIAMLAVYSAGNGGLGHQHLVIAGGAGFSSKKGTFNVSKPIHSPLPPAKIVVAERAG